MPSGYKDEVFESIEDILAEESWEYGDILEVTGDDECICDSCRMEIEDELDDLCDEAEECEGCQYYTEDEGCTLCDCDDSCDGCEDYDEEYGCQCDGDCDECDCEEDEDIEPGLYMYVGDGEEDEFISVEDMEIGDAVEVLKAGHKVARKGWNGKGMYLMLVEPEQYEVDCSVVCANEVSLLPWIGMKTADGCFVPWLCSQSDLLAEDYCYVE